MWFDLVLARVNNYYYRSVRQFFADLQQIAINAAAYNGDDHDVATDANDVVKRIRLEVGKLVDYIGDHQIRQREKEAIKFLTAVKLTKSQTG